MKKFFLISLCAGIGLGLMSCGSKAERDDDFTDSDEIDTEAIETPEATEVEELDVEELSIPDLDIPGSDDNDNSRSSSSASFGSSDDDSSSASSSAPSSKDSKKWDKVLDKYEKFADKYVALYKKVKNGSLSPTSPEYLEYMQEAASYAHELQGADGDLTPQQIARLGKIQAKMASAL